MNILSEKILKQDFTEEEVADHLLEQEPLIADLAKKSPGKGTLIKALRSRYSRYLNILMSGISQEAFPVQFWDLLQDLMANPNNYILDDSGNYINFYHKLSDSQEIEGDEPVTNIEKAFSAGIHVKLVAQFYTGYRKVDGYYLMDPEQCVVYIEVDSSLENQQLIDAILYGDMEYLNNLFLPLAKFYPVKFWSNLQELVENPRNYQICEVDGFVEVHRNKPDEENQTLMLRVNVRSLLSREL